MKVDSFFQLFECELLKIHQGNAYDDNSVISLKHGKIPIWGGTLRRLFETMYKDFTVVGHARLPGNTNLTSSIYNGITTIWGV